MVYHMACACYMSDGDEEDKWSITWHVHAI